MELHELAGAMTALLSAEERSPSDKVDAEVEMESEQEQPMEEQMGLAHSVAQHRTNSGAKKKIAAGRGVAATTPSAAAETAPAVLLEEGDRRHSAAECALRTQHRSLPAAPQSACLVLDRPPPSGPSDASSSPSTVSPRRHSQCPLRPLLFGADTPAPDCPPSMGASAFLNSWRRSSRKQQQEGSSPQRQSLSDLSQDFLQQIIRLFPFPSPQTLLRHDGPVLCRTPSGELSPTTTSCPSSPDQSNNGTLQQQQQSESSSPSICSLSGLRRGASQLAATAKSKRERPRQLALLGGGNKCAANGALGKLCKVSVDTMAITALPLDCWLKERLKNWVQLSGHQGTIVPASNHTLWKKQPQGSQTEARAYAQIMLDAALRGCTPKFYKEIAHREEMFIEIQDLLAQFPDTSTRAIMDIKVGTRTFLESEVHNPSKRADLYRKMVELAPDEPTEQEDREQCVTKLRYMQFRERWAGPGLRQLLVRPFPRESSTATLGFRIEAAQMPGRKLQKNFKKVRTRDAVLHTLLEFFGNRREPIRAQLLSRLRHIRNAVEHSTFFRTHEVVGSSVLIVYDQQRVGAWLIDFAKCTRVDGAGLSHRTEWRLGNHEDGYLTGLDNLIEVLEQRHHEQSISEGKGEEELRPYSD